MQQFGQQPASQPPPPVSYASPWTTAPTPEHLAQLASARTRVTKIKRAYFSAMFSAWTLAIFAGLTFLFSVGSISGMLVGAGLGIVAYFEFQGANGLKRVNPQAPRRLAINQLALAALLFVYGGYSLIATFVHPPEDMSFLMSAADADALGMKPAQMQHLMTTGYAAVYVSVMLVAIVGPGLTAVYYNSRAKYIAEYLKDTPQWILDLQRAGMSI